MLDVRSSTTRFSWVPTSRRVREASEQFDQAHARANESQRERIETLRNVGQFIRESARTQTELGATFETFGDIIIAHQSDSISTSLWTRLQDRRERTTGRLEPLLALSNPEAAEASEHLSVEEYRSKVDQLEAEHDSLQQVTEVRRSVIDGHRSWLDAEWAYRNQRWETARTQFENAKETLRTAADRLERDPVDDTRFDQRYRTLRRFTGVLSDAAAEYEASAIAYREWSRGRNRQQNREEGDERRRAGRRILRDEDAVTEIPSVRRLENYDGP